MSKVWCDYERANFRKSVFKPYSGAVLLHTGVSPQHTTNGVIVLSAEPPDDPDEGGPAYGGGPAYAPAPPPDGDF